MNLIAEKPFSPFGWDLIDDLSAVPENTNYLLERLERGEIYTWVGSLLLAINPASEIPTGDIYNFSQYDKYSNESCIIHKNTKPHIFAIAARAHYRLLQNIGKRSQVIIISGETGTGKTFNACKTLEFLTVINKKSPTLLCQGDCSYDIVQRIADACCLISAFTTACTEKNEVSSRHGQLLKLLYRNGNICGAAIYSFLLERSRVTRGSNSFQIFYQMLAGLPDSELKNTGLSYNEKYVLLDTIDFSKKEYCQEGFEDSVRAMEALGFTEDQKKDVFQVLALLIHMGNIKFLQKGEACIINCNDKESKEALQKTCMLSSLAQNDVVELLTTILINPQSIWRRHTSYHRNLNTIESCRNRLYSIIRYLYDLLFRWLLNHINEVLSVKSQCSKWLGILDIFGFEAFNVNGMEQLCINYANERLQRYFMEMYLETGRKDLQEEGFINSEEPIDKIHLYKERLCVMEEALFLTLNDAVQSLVALNMPRIIQQACANPHNLTCRFLSERDGNFIIKHYAGPVSYSIRDLLSKNSDKVPSEISMIFNISKNNFLSSLVRIDEEKSEKSCTKRCTMLSKLKYNLDILIKELNNCDLHYVRCVRPERCEDSSWNKEEFRKQLACTGILDALPLARCKYPIRFSYEEFCKRYSTRPSETSNIRKKCEIIIKTVTTAKNLSLLVHYGTRMIFLTESIFLKLESIRKKYRTQCIQKIESFWIVCKQKRRMINEPHSNDIQLEGKKSLKQNNNITVIDLTKSLNKKVEENIEEDDDVFINDDDEQKYSKLITENSTQSECKDSMKFTSHYTNAYVVQWLESVGKVMSKEDLIFNDFQDEYDCRNDMSINYSNTNNNNDNNNNNNVNCKSQKSYAQLHRFLNNHNFIRESNEVKDLYVSCRGDVMLFYRNGILSRRRPAEGTNVTQPILTKLVTWLKNWRKGIIDNLFTLHICLIQRFDFSQLKAQHLVAELRVDN